MNNIMDNIKNWMPLPEDTWKQFESIFDLPDVQFDAIYPDLRKSLENIFNGKGFQNELLAELSTIPADTITGDMSDFEDLKNELKENTELSENKKELLIYFLETSLGAAFDLYEVPRERVTVIIERINPNAKIPEYAHKTDAGADVFSAEDVVLQPRETQIIKTGIRVAIPAGYEIQVRPRSGLSFKTDLRIANAPGTIDSDYRGEIGIIMTNIGTTEETIHIGDKIAQLVIAPTPMIKWKEGSVDINTERGEGGFGSTDKKEG